MNVGMFRPLPPSEKGGKDMDPGGNLINLSRFKKLPKKKRKSPKKNGPNPPEVAGQVDCFICQGVNYPAIIIRSL